MILKCNKKENEEKTIEWNWKDYENEERWRGESKETRQEYFSIFSHAILLSP